MRTEKSLGILRSVMVMGVLVVAGACSKRASQTQPTSAKPARAAGPAASADRGDKPSAQGGSLPAGIEVGKLGEHERKVFDQVVGREPSACGKGHSLLYSVQHDGSCRASFYAVRYVARLAASGSSEAEIGEKLEQRFRAARVPYIDVSQAPSKGNPAGPVKIVEFADYECTHCKEAQGPMHALLAEYAKDVVFYFKHFPLGGHVNSLNAAFGAAAAQKQDKFWPYSDKLWASSVPLMPAVLESIAKDVGLDFTRWIADVGSEEVRGLVQRDRTEGRSLEIRRTPAVFINGRRYSDELDLASLKDWLDEELGR